MWCAKRFFVRNKMISSTRMLRSIFLSILSNLLSSRYVSEWFGSVRIRIGFCHTGSNPAPIRFFVGSVRFGLGFCRIESDKKEYEEILLISSLSCVANKYIYIHLAYAACAHAKKNFFCVKFIDLNCSFSKQFEFCKSDENWAQLLALKLRQMLKLFATWCSWCSR
jgi:hypothetical protein